MKITVMTRQGNKAEIECSVVPREGDSIITYGMPELYEDCDYDSPSWKVTSVMHFVEKGEQKGIMVHIKNDEE